ncbi:Rieske (2Fe-2S) protein [Salinithrix halophila]|uniref:Rieske (2Fe-2S) protein n=1 Tax=Salinithrix halophila TaxID=1485204 RepID=A0ABV8JC62_9BACL
MKKDWILVGPLDELQKSRVKLVRGDRYGIAVFFYENEVFAVDNRCPHMGFPLHKGALKDGILTCEWHHARFDIRSGGTLDPWADDVQVHAVEVREGQVWVDPRSKPRVVGASRSSSGSCGGNRACYCHDDHDEETLGHDREDRAENRENQLQQVQERERYRRRLREGLEHNLALVIAKAVVGLVEAEEPPEAIARIGIQFGTTHRRSGWRGGLTILTAMLYILPRLDKKGKILALYHGMVHIAWESAGSGTWFLHEALPEEEEVDLTRLTRWYRQAVEVRDVRGAERILLTAIRAGAETGQLSDMMLAALTDHFYMDTGHVLDFHNKAFEVLEHVGDGERERVLTSLLPQLAGAERSEERHSWQAPVDLVAPLHTAFRELEGMAFGDGKGEDGEEAWMERFLGDRPVATVEKMVSALKAGMAPARLARLVTLAAAERIARFHVQNEFSDWITVLHTFTHAHAVHKSLLRSPSPALMRAVFHGAMSVYLDRFLNVPAARLPEEKAEGDRSPLNPDELLELMDKQQQVAEAAEWVADYLDAGGDKGALFNTLGYSLLREDAEFHSFQMIEAALDEHDRWEAEDTAFARRASRILILAMTRYLAAHAPTAREIPRTANIAWRLHRGEHLFDQPS